MSKKAPPLLIPMLLALGITACSDANPLPTEPSFGKVPGNASPIAQIQTRINALFPQPEKRQANQIFARLKNALATGDQSAAQAQALALVDLAASTELNDPKGPETTEEALSRLFDELFDLTGLEAVIEVVEAGEETTVLVATEDAGVFFPAGSVAETVLVVIARIELGEGEDCLPTIREQREGCYSFSTIPEQEADFTADVTIGICVDVTGLTDEQIDNFHLYGFDEGDDNVRELENTTVNFLNCDDFASLELRHEGLLTRFAYALSRGVGRLLGPQELLAANLGLGGLTRSFTRIGWAGATAIIYGPSLNPTNTFRTSTTETVANFLGIAADVVDGTTWSLMSATGEGGFGDYDAIVFGDGGNLAAFSDADANTSWGSIATGPVVVSGIHAVNHICDIGCPLPPVPAVPHDDQFPPSAREFVETGLEYAVSGIETGVFALMGRRYAGVTTPVSIDWLSGLGAFTAVRGGPKRHHTLTDATHFLVPSHPVLTPFTEAELSGWFATNHNYLPAVPTGFTVIAEGHFWNRPFTPPNVGNKPNDSAQMTHLPVIIVR